MVAILFRSSLILALAVGCSAAGAQRIAVSLNGAPVTFEGTQPQEVNGRVMVPLRGVLEQMGAQVKWDSVTRTVTAIKADTLIRLPLDQNRAEVNGKSIPLDVPAMIVMGRTMVPLRFVAESLGGAVSWDAETRLVRIATATAGETAVGRDSRAFVRTRTVSTDRVGRLTNAEPLITALAFLHEDAVIPVKLDAPLNSGTSKPGDRVSATVESGGFDGRLPRGTRFVGTLRQAIPAVGDRSGALAVQFTEMRFPDGTWRSVNAVPFPLETRYVTGSETGMLTARNGGTRGMMFVGFDKAPKLTRADVLPTGRLRVFFDPSADRTIEERPAEVDLPGGFRFGLRIDRHITFDPVERIPDDNR